MRTVASAVGRRFWCAVWAAVFGLLCTLAVAQPVLDLDRQVEFDIPAQPLSSALVAFSRQAGVQVLTATKDLEGIQGSAVKGRWTLRESLNKLLDGTGLVAIHEGNNAVAVKPKAGKTPPASTISSATLPSTSRGRDVERLEVTGSRISQVEVEGASPVITFDREKIRQAGAVTVRDLIAYLPQASVNPDLSPRNSSFSAATIRLRGLSSGLTLILINGRRVISSSAQSSQNFFDINSIPASAVERVEVLTESASAVYGADAVAGVVNIVLKKGANLGSIDLNAGRSSESDGDQAQASLSKGFSWSTGNAGILLDVTQQEPIFGRDRDRIRNPDHRRFGGLDSRSFSSNPGNIYSLTAGANLPGLSSTFAAVPAGSSGIGLRPADFVATAGTRNFVSILSESPLVLRYERYSGLGTAETHITPTIKAFAELLYSTVDKRQTSVPNQLSGGAAGTFRVAANNPFNPFGVAVGVDYRLSGLPAPRNEVQEDFGRLLAGVKGGFGPAWSWEIAGLATNDRSRISLSGLTDAARIRTALASTDLATALNVFQDGPGGSPELLASFVTAPLNQDLRTAARQGEAQLRNTQLIDLPAGSVELVAGAEWRDEELRTKLTGFGANDRNDRVSRSFSSFYSEVFVPILDRKTLPWIGERLSAIAAVRYDKYEDFGAKTSPQLGLKWSLSPSAIIRASEGRAYHPAALVQAYSAVTVLPATVADPQRGNEAISVPVVRGGNRSLEPETGKANNVGIVYAPAGLPISVASLDFWRVLQDRRITQLTTTALLANEAIFASRVQRAAPTAADVAAGRPGRLTQLDVSFLNQGRLDVRGVDARLGIRANVLGGSWRSELMATYVRRYEAAVLPTSPIENRAGAANADGYAPKWKGTLTTAWSRGPWDLFGAVRYTHSYTDYPSTVSPRTVAAQVLFDAQVAYKPGAAWHPVLNGVSIALGVRNVFDRMPPYSAIASYGYDTAQYDLIGRFIYLRLSKPL